MTLNVPSTPPRASRHYEEGVLEAHMSALRFKALQENSPEKRRELEIIISALERQLTSQTRLAEFGPRIRGAVQMANVQVRRERTLWERLRRCLCPCCPRSRDKVSPLPRSTADLEIVPSK